MSEQISKYCVCFLSNVAIVIEKRHKILFFFLIINHEWTFEILTLSLKILFSYSLDSYIDFNVSIDGNFYFHLYENIYDISRYYKHKIKLIHIHSLNSQDLSLKTSFLSPFLSWFSLLRSNHFHESIFKSSSFLCSFFSVFITCLDCLFFQF